MTKDDVVQTITETLKSADNRGWELHVVNASDQPVDGYWYVLVEPEREPEYPFDYLDLLAKVEDELASKHVRALLTPAIDGTYEYLVEGETIEVIERKSGNFTAGRKRSHGGPHYSATYDSAGNRRLMGTSGSGSERLGPPSEELLGRYQKAIDLHIGLRKRPASA